MNLTKLLWLLPFVLVGCEKGPNLAKTCEQNQQICAELQEDNYCKKERKATIFANVNLNTTKKDLQKYELLIAYEHYVKCMSLASQIEHIKLKEKKTKRIDNLIKAKARIKELSLQTAKSEHPYLLYFHWTRYLNNVALAKFLKQEGSALLETPESQLNLATYYTKINSKKTLALLFHALELYKADETINTEIFKSLTSIFTHKKEYKQGYIWLKVLSLYAPKDIDLGKESVEKYGKSHKLNSSFLNKVAENTLDKIEQGIFKVPKF